MSKKQKLFLILNFVISFALIGFILIKPYVVDQVLDIDGKELGFVGIYDNPLIYFLILINFINSFVLIGYIVFLQINQILNINKKWIKFAVLSIFLFLITLTAHHKLVRYSVLEQGYKQHLQEKLGVWNQNIKKNK